MTPREDFNRMPESFNHAAKRPSAGRSREETQELCKVVYFADGVRWRIAVNPCQPWIHEENGVIFQ